MPSATGAHLLSARECARVERRYEKPTGSPVQGYRLADGLCDPVGIAVIDHQLELDLRDERDAVLQAPIELGMGAMRIGASHVAHDHVPHVSLRQGLAHFGEDLWVDDGLELLHGLFLLSRVDRGQATRSCHIRPRPGQGGIKGGGPESAVRAIQWGKRRTVRASSSRINGMTSSIAFGSLSRTAW